MSSWDEAQPAPFSNLLFLISWGQSASRPAQTPRQEGPLHEESLPTVSAALARNGDGRALFGL